MTTNTKQKHAETLVDKINNSIQQYDTSKQRRIVKSIRELSTFFNYRSADDKCLIMLRDIVQFIIHSIEVELSRRAPSTSKNSKNSPHSLHQSTIAVKKPQKLGNHTLYKEDDIEDVLRHPKNYKFNKRITDEKN